MIRSTHIIALAAALTATHAASAQSINWMTIDCGGERSTGGAYSLRGSIGQYDASPESLTYDFHTIKLGFWPSGARYSCVGDYNRTGTITLDDLFGFLNAYFTAHPSADVNGIDGVTIQDVFDFLTGWFRGGCA